MIGDRKDASAQPILKRAIILSEDPTFWQRAGNAAYLSAFCRVLRSLNYRVHLIFVRNASQTISRFEPDYLSSVDNVALRNTIRLGHRFVATTHRLWLRAIKSRLSALRRRMSKGDESPTQSQSPWLLPPLDPSLVDWARKQIHAIGPDLVVANYFNAADVFEPNAEYRKAILVHDVFALRSESYLEAGLPNDFDITHLQREAQAFSHADLCIAITPQEAAYIKSVAPESRTLVLPHMVEVKRPKREKRPAKHCVFVGSHNLPNQQGLSWLLDEIWPRVLARTPDASLSLIGNLVTPDKSQLPRNVEAKGSVADLAHEYESAAVVLVPPRAGSGLKVKLIEALAHGVPVVATSCGAAGVGGASETFLRIRDDAEEFAQAMCELMSAPDWQDRAEAALDFVSMHFSEQAVSKVLRDALSETRTPAHADPSSARGQGGFNSARI